jgi:RHS repeat-associated protein
MNPNNHLILSTSPLSQPAKNPRVTVNLSPKQRPLYGRKRRYHTGKERDSETGLYYYGARYLDSKTSRWLSGDPAMGEYVPSAPVDDEARKRNGNLPGMGGVFNYVNLHVYHYAGNNPVKYTDPDGEDLVDILFYIFNSAMNGDLKASTLNNVFPSPMPPHYAKADQSNNPLTAKDALKNGFYAVEPEQAALHRQGEGNEYNLKMIHPDGREAVYNKKGNLVTDPLNLGTKNTVNPGTIVRDAGHALLDVGPYLPLGNTKDDNPGLGGMKERINAGINPPPIPADYHEHWKDFYPIQNGDTK